MGTYLKENCAVTMEQGTIADVRMADHPAQVRSCPPNLQQVKQDTVVYLWNSTVQSVAFF